MQNASNNMMTIVVVDTIYWALTIVPDTVYLL